MLKENVKIGNNKNNWVGEMLKEMLCYFFVNTEI